MLTKLIFSSPQKLLSLGSTVTLVDPLRTGLMLMNNEPTWFRMKCIKLPDLCYAWWLLEHVYQRCEFYDASVPESNLQYGPWK